MSERNFLRHRSAAAGMNDTGHVLGVCVCVCVCERERERFGGPVSVNRTRSPQDGRRERETQRETEL